MIPTEQKRVVLLAYINRLDEGGFMRSYSNAALFPFEFLVAYAQKSEEVRRKWRLSMREYPDVESLIDDVRRVKPAVLGFSCHVLNIATNLKAACAAKAEIPDIKVVLGGPEVVDAGIYLEENPFVDYIVRGEGEDTLMRLLKALGNCEDATMNIPGLSYRGAQGIVHMENASLLEDLGAIPSIFTTERIQELGEMVFFQTSRGCSYGCRMCVWTKHRRRFFPFERVESELALLLGNPDVRHIFFIDSEFGDVPEQTRRVLECIRRHNKHGTKFTCFLAVERIDRESLELCAAIGFPTESPIGLQSIHQDVLNAAGRKWFNVKEFEEQLQMVLEYIPHNVFTMDIIYGLPEDNYEKLCETVRWCLDHKLDQLNIIRLGGYPNTAFYRLRDRFGLIFQDRPPYHVIRSNTFTPEDIEKTERVIIWLQTMLKFLTGNDCVELKKRGVDLVSLCETLIESGIDWKRYIRLSNESNIGEVNSEILLPILEFLRDKRLPPSAFGYLVSCFVPHIG